MIKITNCTKLTALFSMFCSIAYIHPNTTLAASPHLELALNEQENTLKQILKQLDALDVALEELILMTNNSGTILNKRERLDYIKEQRDFIKQLRDNPFTVINNASLKVLLTIVEAITQNVHTAIKTDFNTRTSVDLEQLITRAVPTDVSYEQLQATIGNNSKKLELLVDDIRQVGLTWYNKAYREFDASVVQPFNKYKMGKYLKWGGIAGAAALALWWQSDSDNHWLRHNRFLGPKPEYDGANYTQLRNAAELGYLGKINHFFLENSKGHFPVNSWLYGALIAASLPELSSLKSYTEKKWTEAIHYLKGGAYANKKTNDLDRIIPKVTLNDIVGLEFVKETFQLIVKYLEDPERFDRTKLTPEKGFLLTGPTRTGKTFSAEALAGEIREMLKRQGKDPDDFNFFVLRASFIKDKGIRWIFDKARDVAPCILFIDEIDLLQLQRVGNNDLLSEFLTSMSGCLENNDPSKPVIVIAATNKPENLDIALRQRGRFGTELRYEYPSEQDRKNFLVQKLGSLSISLDIFDIDQLVRETERCSYEDLNALIRSAFQRAKLRGEIMTQRHLEEAVDREIRHIIFNHEKELPQDEKNTLSIQMAGQAVALMLLNSKQQLAKVTIKPCQAQIHEESAWDMFWKINEEDKQKKIIYGKLFSYHTRDTFNIDSFAEKTAKIKVQIAGNMAEKLILGSCGYNDHGKNGERAFHMAKSIASQGIDISGFPDNVRADYIRKALALVQQCEQEITALLEPHKDAIVNVAKALSERQILTRDEVAEIMGIATRKSVDTSEISAALGINEQLPVAAAAA